MITTLRRSTIALLASSLLLTIGRGAALPFMTIYLTRRFQLEVDVIGYALSLALVVGCCSAWVLASSLTGSIKSAIWCGQCWCSFSASAQYRWSMTPLVVIFFALINCAYSVFSTVLKACSPTG